jgi:uncharacterized membrane protein
MSKIKSAFTAHLLRREICMEIVKLIGVLIVIAGFILKLDTLAVVVTAGLATGLVAGVVYALLFDRILKRRFGDKRRKKEAN